MRAWLITVARREAIRLDRIRRRYESMSIGAREPGAHLEPPTIIDLYAQVIDLDEAPQRSPPCPKGIARSTR